MSIKGTDVTVELGFGFGPLEVIADNDWTDVTDLWRQISTTRGRSYELDRMQAGIATVVLDNRSGNFHPHNTAGDYYPDVRPMVPIRIVASRGGNDYPLFRGFVERWQPSFPGTVDSVVTLQCVDLFKLLNLAGVASNRQTVVEALDPVAWWRFTDAGTDDSSTAGTHDLTFAGSPTTNQPGAWQGDESVTFDGTNDAATVANETDVERQGLAKTIECWVRPTGSSGIDQIFSIDNAGATILYGLFWDDGEFGVMNGATVAAAAVDEWHHVVMTTEPGGSPYLNLYVDGVLVGSEAQFSYSEPTGTVTVRIGNQNGANFFAGDISEIAVYGSVLTAPQVQALHAASFDTFPTERTDERIARIIADYGYTLTDLEEGQTEISGPNSPLNTTVLEGIQIAADTEFGQFFMAPNGDARFHDRHYRLIEQSTPIASFDASKYRVLEPETDDELVANDIRVATSESGMPFIATDGPASDPATSQGRYGHRTLERTIYPDNELEGYDFAHYLKGLYAEPSTRVPKIFFRLGKDTTLWATVLAAEIGNRYNVILPLEGDDLDQDVYLEAINMTINAQTLEWDVDWQLSPAAAQQFFQWGVSEWGIDTKWAY